LISPGDSRSADEEAAVNSASSSGASLAWEDLTAEQQYVLNEAIQGERMIDVLNGWAGYSPDAAYWNRKEKYVAPMLLATKSLVELGLIEVYREVDAPGQDELLPLEVGVHVVSEPDNWWRYDPEQNWDPDAIEPPPPSWSKLHEVKWVMYWLNGTESGEQVSNARKVRMTPSAVVIESRGSTGPVDLSRKFEFRADGTWRIIE
jgi:hypothetical protein